MYKVQFTNGAYVETTVEDYAYDLYERAQGKADLLFQGPHGFWTMIADGYDLVCEYDN